MFQKNDYIVYGSEGVCLVEDVRRIEFDRVEEKEYFVLRPVGKNSANVFVPSDSEVLLARMRPVLSKEAIDATIDRIRGKRLPWIEDRKRRSMLFRQIRTEMKSDKLLLMIACLYQKKEELLFQGKKLAFADADALSAAETLVNSEFSFSLGIDSKDVSAYIQNRLNTK